MKFLMMKGHIVVNNNNNPEDQHITQFDREYSSEQKMVAAQWRSCLIVHLSQTRTELDG